MLIMTSWEKPIFMQQLQNRPLLVLSVYPVYTTCKKDDHVKHMFRSARELTMYRCNVCAMPNVCSDSRRDMASLRGPHLIPNNPNDSKATKTKMKGYPSGSGEKKKIKCEWSR